MNLFDPVSAIMSKQLVTASENDPINLLGELFEKNNIHHVLITKGGKFSGIVSKSDYLLFNRTSSAENNEETNEERLKSHHISEIMTYACATLQSDEKITIALELFRENIFRALPILESDNLVGIVTPLDIINRLAQDKEAVSEYNLKD